MDNKKISKKEMKRQQKYDEMIKHQPESKRNWMKEKPYQLLYREKVEHERTV